MDRTPAQIKAIQSWVDQRDALIREVGIVTVELEGKNKANIEAGLAFADLEKQIAEARGRLAELDALEERKRTSTATDVAELEVRKSRLEGECALLDAKLASGGEKYVLVTGATSELEVAHALMKDQAAIVNRVAGELVELSTTSLVEVKEKMTEIRTVVAEVIEKGNANVAQTNIVLEKLPRYIFELQKPIPLRRTFAAPRGAVIEPVLKNKDESTA